MNRIIIEPGEVSVGGVRLTDARATHIREILRAVPGSQLRIGISDGALGVGTVTRCDAEAVELNLALTTDRGAAPWCDLILAMPRPRAFKRLLPQVTALGVRHIWLVGATRVERCYFGSHWLRPEAYRPLLLEGLMQAGTTVVPQIYCAPRLAAFVQEHLPAITAHSVAYLAHPQASNDAPARATAGHGRAVLAVGPEGGWLDAELALFDAHGFRHLSLGERILRTDTACVALLALLARHHDPAARG